MPVSNVHLDIMNLSSVIPAFLDSYRYSKL